MTHLTAWTVSFSDGVDRTFYAVTQAEALKLARAWAVGQGLTVTT